MNKISTALLLFWVMQMYAYANSPGRGPSVEPLVEVDIESSQKFEKPTGYDFKQPVSRKPSMAKTRVPANITTRSSTNSFYSYLGPFIFLITLPIALWIMVSKRFRTKEDKNIGYYGKTHQFKPRQAEYESNDEEDDTDYPKAS